MIVLPPLLPMPCRPVPEGRCWDFAALSMWVLEFVRPRRCGGCGSLFLMARAQAAIAGMGTIFQPDALSGDVDPFDLVLLDLDGVRSSPEALLQTWLPDLAPGGVLLLHGWNADTVEPVGQGISIVRMQIGEGLLALWRKHPNEENETIWAYTAEQRDALSDRVLSVSRDWLKDQYLLEARERIKLLEHAASTGIENSPVHPARMIEPAPRPGIVGRIQEFWMRRRMSKALSRHPEFFDADWYTAFNADLAIDRAATLDHFLKVGLRCNLDCSPRFNGAKYLDAYPDVAAARIHPLLHFLENGMSEGRLSFSASRSTSNDEVATSKHLGTDLSASTIFPVTVGVVWPSGMTLEALQQSVAHIATAMQRLGQARSDRILVGSLGRELPPTAFSTLFMGVTVIPDGRETSVPDVHNRLMKIAFGTGAKIYVAVSAETLLEPNCLISLIRTVRASGRKKIVGGVAADQTSTAEIDELERDWVGGQCIAIPLYVFEHLGGLDADDFPIFGADVEFCLRARDMNIGSLACPLAQYSWTGIEHDPDLALRAAHRLAVKRESHQEAAAILDQIEGGSPAAQSGVLSHEIAEYLRTGSRTRRPW
jgi:hypothetical protein